MALTHLGLAIVTLILSSNTLKTGTQYLPVDSIHKNKQSLAINHFLNSSKSLLKVENRFLIYCGFG